MNHPLRLFLFVFLVLVSLSLNLAVQAQQSRMTFFITSVGLGNGADLGGLEGADRHCQALAEAVGAGGHTWRAYLSTQAVGNAQAVNARDRIGRGPWQNSHGVVIAKDVENVAGVAFGTVRDEDLVRFDANAF